LAALLAAVSCGLAAGQSRSAEPATVTWSEIRPHLAAGLAVLREAPARWVLAPSSSGTAAPGSEGGLPAIAAEALSAARDDIAWIVGEVATARFDSPGDGVAFGQTVPVPDPVVSELFESGPFVDPLRKFTDAALRAHGMTCSGCLRDLRPSRDLSWRTIRDYLKAFIFVAKLDETGLVDLRVGRSENALPAFAECDQDLAGATYAMMQAVIRRSPAFQHVVETALNEELLSLGEADPEQARRRLNHRVPDRILQDPSVGREFLARLPESLDLHGLRCIDCPRPQAEF
jgi:hypothetical protein